MFINFGDYYYQPGNFNPGIQIYNPGIGGPKSHMEILARAPRSWPTTYGIIAAGLGAMPRQVIGPTLPIMANNYSTPRTISNLEIAGLFKPPFGDQIQQ